MRSHLRDPSLYQIEKILCYLVIITGFFGAALLPIDIGAFKLFPYRIFFIMLLPLFCIRILFKDGLRLFNGGIKWHLVFLILWMAYSSISLAWTISKVDALKDILFLFMGISLIFFICRYFKDKKDLTLIYYICFAAFVCMILIGFWEIKTGSHLSSSMFFSYPAYSMPTGVFYNQNDFASFLALYIPFGIGILCYTRSAVPRLLAVLSVCGAVYLIIIADCVSGLLAVALELVALFVLFFINERKINKRKSYWLVVFVSLVCAVILWKYPIINQHIQQMASVDERFNLIRNGLHFLRSTFGFGVGAGNVEYWMANYARYEITVLNIHNWWAEVLAEYGVFVFAGYVLFYLGIIYKLLRVFYKTTKRFEKLFSSTLILSLCGFFFACNGPSSFLNINAQWYIFGIALSFLYYITSFEEQNSRL